MWRACNLTAFTHGLAGPVGKPFASRHEGPGFKPQGGYFCETGILLLALSRYIGDPAVIPDHCGLVWGGLRPEPSLGPRADNVIIPFDLTQLFCLGFTLAAGPLSSFTTDSQLLGGSPVERLQSHHIHIQSHWSSGSTLYSRHEEPGFNSQVGTYVKPGFSC
jgi:hypothetical protein